MRARLLLLALLALFGVTMVYAVYSVTFYGGRWFANPYNPRLAAAKRVVTPGDIRDRHGVALASTDGDGARSYPVGRTGRKASGHVIGDTTQLVPGGAETMMAQHLLGFTTSIPSRFSQLFSGGTRYGNDVYLTVSQRLQLYAHEQFPSGNDGSAVVINYKTGEILLMYSKPELDPAMTREDMLKTESALVNRATQGKYTPGSIFKVVTAAAMLARDANAASRTFTCTGVLEVGQRPVKCNEGAVHGTLDLKRAFDVSCNAYFASAGLEMGQQALLDAAHRLGFNDDNFYPNVVLNPSTTAAGRLVPEELAWTSVGQGTTLVTPLHMAMIAGAIANGGVMMQPELLLQVTSHEGGMVSWYTPRADQRVLTQAEASALEELMISVVKEGTGSRAKVSGRVVGGKTGTAQVSDSKAKEPHAWFIGFIKDDEHPYAVAVVVENGGSGAQKAAALAGKLLSRAVSD